MDRSAFISDPQTASPKLVVVEESSAGKHASIPLIRRLGLMEYLPAWRAMQELSARRTCDTPDEIWLLQHLPVFTLGLNGKREHLLVDTAIPVVRTDRGGQITYHAPGQIVAYLLLDLKRLGHGVRALVRRCENAVIELLAHYGIESSGDTAAPGVYVQGAKVAAVGLRIKNGCCYHGLSLNVAMNLAPFNIINPCGRPGLRVTQLRDLGVKDSIDDVTALLTLSIQKTIYGV